MMLVKTKRVISFPVSQKKSSLEEKKRIPLVGLQAHDDDDDEVYDLEAELLIVMLEMKADSRNSLYTFPNKDCLNNFKKVCTSF